MLHIFCGSSPSLKLQSMIQSFCSAYSDIRYADPDALPCLEANDSILFAIDIDEWTGIDLEILLLIKKAAQQSSNYFYGVKGALLCCANSMLHTKTFCSHIALLINRLGLSLIGKPMVEALPNYRNFINKQKLLSLPLEEICLSDCAHLGQRLYKAELPFSCTKIIAIHTSRPELSNTYALMSNILNCLPCEKKIFSLFGEKIMDCRGCLHSVCMKLSSDGRCYYQGDILDEIFQNLLVSDTLMIACPNYNDSMPANYFALVNRMTYIYRAQDLSQKNIYAIIVSSNSGSDMVAAQVISAFCFNKGFRLPPYFTVMEQACEPLSILNEVDIETVISNFIDKIHLDESPIKKQSLQRQK